ncbi:hypothetical protein [Clostridium sporogenes]|nr:hypothetical protein [Clostridium sporogenes]
MDKYNKEALIDRLNYILKYAEEGRIENIKEEVERLLDEVEHFDVVVPF